MGHKSKHQFLQLCLPHPWALGYGGTSVRVLTEATEIALCFPGISCPFYNYYYLLLLLLLLHQHHHHYFK